MAALVPVAAPPPADAPARDAAGTSSGATSAAPSLGTVAAVAAIAAAPLVISGCGGGGGGGAAASPPRPDATTITSVTLVVQASEPATVRVAGAADQDGAGADATGRVRFALGVDRPADPGLRGVERVYEFAVTAAATTTADGSDETWVEVRINPDPQPLVAGAATAIAPLRRLFHRACFGASAQDLARWRDVPYAQVVDALLDGARTEGVLPAPAWRDEAIPTWQESSAMSDAERAARDATKGERIQRMKSDWLREMVITPSPLTERMTLFWHNHFVTASWDLFEPTLTWSYLALLRRHALGSFADLLHAMAREPAMVAFLDSASNVKGSPNENFARELMELFTLGEGHDYGEADVVAMARCFTGWGLTPRRKYSFDPAKHDTGAKSVFGVAVTAGGEGDGDQALDLILAKDRCAQFLVEKLCLEFIGSVPAEAATWAGAFKAGGYQIKPLLRSILTSAAFMNAPAGGLQRAPADLHVGLWRATELEPTDYGGEHWELSEEDQDLLDPPNVRGWIGGEAWMSSRTLLRRREFLGWKQWEMQDRVPERLRAVLPTLLMPIAAYDTAALDPAAYPSWDRVGGPFRALFVDPAIHLK